MLGEIDGGLEPQKSRLFLCRPNRTTIAELPEAYGKDLNLKYNGIHELSFQLPYKILKNHQYIRNPHVDILRGHYLIRYEKGNTKEYFIIDKPSNSANNGIESKTVQCYLLPYGIRNKIVRLYSGTKQLYDDIGSDGVINETLLARTDWTIGHVDDFMTEINGTVQKMYRTFDVTEQNLLDFITEVARTFDASIVWDTVNKTVSFYKHENLGQNKGFLIEEGKYLKSIGEEPDFENVVTRLYVYGKDEISINRNNPSGTDYIESFDYYMYPFERDETTGEVLQHSRYMSDSLCHAILDYQALVASKQGEFTDLLSQKETLQETRSTKETELFNLKVELASLNDQLDVANANGDDTTLILQDRDAKQADVDAKQAEIDQIDADIADIDSQIATIRNEIKVENNFTAAQLEERNSFIIEKVFSDQYISDEAELYKVGVEQLGKINQPRINYTINSVNFLNVVSAQRDWDKVVIGDIVTVRYPNFNINIKAKIINIREQEDSNGLQFEIANADDIDNGFLELKDLMKTTVSTSTKVGVSKHKWDKSEENTGTINDILNNTWDATKREIQAGVNESVDISRRGIIIKDPNDPLKMLVAQHGTLALSSDGGDTWKTAIKPSGIYAERLVGKIIAGVNLIIENSSGTFTVDSDGMTVVDMDSTITTSDGLKRILQNATDGIKIQSRSSTSSSWVDKFRVNTSGSLYSEDLTAKKIIITDGTDNVLINASNKTLDLSGFDNILVSNLSTISSDLGSITAGYLYGVTIEGGSIKSNTTIDVTTDLYVGNNIHMGDSSSTELKMIRFKNSATMSSPSGTSSTLKISAQSFRCVDGSVYLGSSNYDTKIDGAIDFSSADSITWGSNAPVAVLG